MSFDWGGALIGGGAKTSSTSTRSNEVGFSEIDGPAVSLNLGDLGEKANQQITLQMLDGGAIRDALNFAKSAQDSSAAGVTQAYALAQAARQSETSGAINNFLKYGAIVIGIGLAAWALKKSH